MTEALLDRLAIRDLIGLKGSAVEALYGRGAAWLAGEALPPHRAG